jgi:hypothetical protein
MVDAKLAQIHALLPLREENVEAFLELVAETVDLGDPSSIRPLLMIVDEGCPLSGVMDALLRNLEEFPSDVYDRELLAALPMFCTRSPFWCESEIKKRLWSVEERETLIAALPKATDQAREVLRELLTRVRDDTPQLKQACTEVLTKL